MKKLSIFFFVMTFIVTMSSFAQTNQTTDVNKDIDLVKVYEEVVKEGYGTPRIYKELANIQYFRSNYAEAKKWFEKLFDTNNTYDETLIHRYKQSLKALNIQTESNRYLAVSGTN